MADYYMDAGLHENGLLESASIMPKHMNNLPPVAAPQDLKADASKPIVARGVLLQFPRAMLAVARASELGKIKYGVPEDDRNFANSSYRRYLDPITRHLIQHDLDGPWNVETGGKLPPDGLKVLHLAQAAWSALAALDNYLAETPYALEQVREGWNVRV